MIDLETVMMLYQVRGVGHTHVALHGIKDLPETFSPIVIINNRAEEDMVKRVNPKARVFTVSSDPNKLRGIVAPVVVDHFALAQMFWDYKKKRDEELKSAEMQYRAVIDLLSEEQEKVKELKSKLHGKKRKKNA